MNLTSLHGIWRLLYITYGNSTSSTTSSLTTYGPHPLGRITLTPTGYFNALIVNPDRFPLIGNATSWSQVNEKAAANLSKSTTAYSGWYTVAEEEDGKGGTRVMLRTRVEVSLNPLLVNTVQKRMVDYRREVAANGTGVGGTREIMVLTPIDSNGTNGNPLTWEKMPDGGIS
ncbi:hypothetical protein B0J14DRAFT_646132 [Halenospora varia]|nr:hypothetical protein B0J14DRAFT_646132 [Halenospora varia]